MPGPWEKYADQDTETGPWSKYGGKEEDGIDLNAATQGFGNFATAGYLPELTGGLGKLLPDPNKPINDVLARPLGRNQQPINIQEKPFQGMSVDDSRAMQTKMASESPYSYYGGGVAGAIASAPAYGSTLKALGIAKELPVAAEISEGAPLLTKAGQYAASLGPRVLQAGKEGAALGFAANPNSNPGDQGFSLGRRVVNAGTSGLVSGAIPVVSDAVKGFGNAVQSGSQWAGSRLLSFVGGVKPDNIEEYAQFSKRINSAPNVEELKNISDDFVGKLKSDVDAKTLTLDQAKGAYREFQSDLKDAYKTSGYDAADAVTSAKQSLKDAHSDRIQQLSQDVYDTVKQLKTDVSKGSSESYSILDKSGESIPVNPIKKKIDGLVNDLKVAGKSAVGDDATSAVNQLQNLRNTLDQFPKDLPATEAKKMLQQLQRSTDYARGAGTFSDSANQAFQSVNASINKALKSRVPEYAAKMEQVATDTDLLSRVSDFGDKQTGVGILGRIEAPNQLERKAALQQLGQKYNADFVSAANPKNLPEQAFLDKAEAAREALRPDRVSEKLDQTLGASRQNTEFQNAKAGLDQAQQNLAPFKSLAPNNAGQTMAQQKLMQLASGKNIELEQMFKQLGKMTNTDFVQAMKDQNTLAAFKKGAVNGSRNTLMGALVGFLIGGVPGLAGGGASGRVVDQWGPAITKKILDGAIAVANSPSVKTIQSLSLPEPIKKNMVMGFQNYMAQMGPIVRGSVRGPDAWANKGLQNLGIGDQQMASRLMSDPKGKDLLIQASDLKPGSKAMQTIMNQIQKGWGNP